MRQNSEAMNFWNILLLDYLEGTFHSVAQMAAVQTAISHFFAQTEGCGVAENGRIAKLAVNLICWGLFK